MRIIVLAAALLCCASAHAWPSPRQAVDQFLRFDLAGGRLQSWPFRKYLDADAGYDEPGWDMIHVVRNYRIASIRCRKGVCRAAVVFAYPDIALASERIHPHAAGGSETVVFTVVKANGNWLLAGSEGAPRISQAEFERRFPNGSWGLLPFPAQAAQRTR